MISVIYSFSHCKNSALDLIENGEFFKVYLLIPAKCQICKFSHEISYN